MQESVETRNPRELALSILKKLLIALPGLTADIFYQALLDGGFSEDEAVKNTGSCLRTGSARCWAKKTNLCQNSLKNHSNLQKIWKSLLYRADQNLDATVALWADRGFEVPLAELNLWDQIQKAKTVSK